MAIPQLSIGIEEEFQIIDPETRELAAASQRLIELSRARLADESIADELKPEFLQCQVEIGTKVCGDIAEARAEILRLRRFVAEVAEEAGLAIAAASTHPFSRWSNQQVTVADRYNKLASDLKIVARRMVIFGMHVHVGIDDPELRIDVLNQARYFLPHLLALSTSSPLWHGHETGLKSYRAVIFENMPRSGIPPAFRAWNHYEEFIDTLVRTGSIDEPSKIWWDIRPHSKYPTIEFRVCDVCTRVDETICIAALIKALVAKLIKLRMSNQCWRVYPHHLIEENKWRAVRYGLEGKLIDFGRKEEVPMRFLALELLDLVDDVLDEQGVRAEVEYLHRLLANGSSADRQLATFRATGDAKMVVDRLLSETMEGVRG